MLNPLNVGQPRTDIYAHATDDDSPDNDDDSDDEKST